MTELRTERLLLRQWRESDREPWAAMSADTDVMEFFPSTLGRDEADAALDRFAAAIETQGWGLWAVENDGRFLGFTGLSVPRFDAPFTPATEIGWRLAKHAWGHGYATEAARAVVDAAFGELGLTELVSMTSVLNERSQRVMRRLGMTRDPSDDFDHPLVPEGSPLRPHVLYRLAATDAAHGGARA